MMSGDWIPVSLPGVIRAVLPEAQVISLGGATEASVWSIVYPIETVSPDWASIPYGTPLANQRWHVLDDEMRPPRRSETDPDGVREGLPDRAELTGELEIDRSRRGEIRGDKAEIMADTTRHDRVVRKRRRQRLHDDALVQAIARRFDLEGR